MVFWEKPQKAFYQGEHKRLNLPIPRARKRNFKQEGIKEVLTFIRLWNAEARKEKFLITFIRSLNQGE